MTRKNLALTLIVLGIVLLAASLAADLLGFGARVGVGWKQLIGAGLGVLLTLAGIWLNRPRVGAPK